MYILLNLYTLEFKYISFIVCYINLFVYVFQVITCYICLPVINIYCISRIHSYYVKYLREIMKEKVSPFDD